MTIAQEPVVERSPNPQPVSMKSGMDLALGRLLAIPHLHGRLMSDPPLIIEFWNELASPERLRTPDTTVLYCRLTQHGQTYLLLEFVAGETLEELVRRVEPSKCEQIIPLYCQVLDSFDAAAQGSASSGIPKVNKGSSFDFGIERVATYSRRRVYGTVMFQPDGKLSEEVFSDNGAARSDLYPQLLAVYESLMGRLPGEPEQTPAGQTPVAKTPLPEPEAPVLPEPAAEPPASPAVLMRRRPIIRAMASFGITAATAAGLFLGIGGAAGYLAKRTAGSPGFTLPSWVQPENPEPEKAASEAVRVEKSKRVPPKAAQSASRKTAATARKTALAAPAVRAVPVNTSSTASPRSGDQTAAAPPLLAIDRTPRIVEQSRLEYPVDARSQGVSGLVRLEVTITEDGSVQQPRVLSGHPLLLNGVADAVKRWKYEPAMMNGKPVPMIQEIEIDFSLDRKQGR